MALNDERLIKNSLLFISLRGNSDTDDNIEDVKKWIEEGADVNAMDGNDGGNSPLHVAARKGRAAIAQLLIQEGAEVTRKNWSGETPLDFARTHHTDHREIIHLLEKAEESTRNHNNESLTTRETQNAKIECENDDRRNGAVHDFKFVKRAGTSGVCGQLYETKLLSLVLMRALNDDQIEHFLLGTNIRGVGDMDDICLRYRVRGLQLPIVLFVQAKHREDTDKGRLTVEDVRSASGDFSLRKYFESYLTIKDRFRADTEDPMFEGDFSDVECNLVIYTPAKESFSKKKTEREVSEKVHYLINTGEETEIFQYDHDENDIELLTKMTVIERLKKLGAVFLEFIMSEKNKPEMLLIDKHIARYHVVMAREVLQQSKVQQVNKECRLWEFRPEFFESDSEYLVALKRTFVKELSTKRCDQSKISNTDRDNFQQLIEHPCADTIGKLIGKLVTYNEKTKKLQLIEVSAFMKKIKSNEFQTLKLRLSKIVVNENIINKAVEIKLATMEIKLPLSFGNLDMTFRGSEAKVQKRIKTVADKVIHLLEINKNTKIVEINDDIVGPGKIIEQGILDINGGIGSAVGNLFVLDSDTNMLQFDLENKALPEHTALFLKELNNVGYKPVNENLKQYRIKINIEGFPKDSFNGDEYDKRQARDFLNKLWFYANQAKEDKVERILKGDINKYYNNEKDAYQFKFKIHSDAIFLRSHDEIQKWWMQPGETSYLNKSSELFDLAKQAVIDNPLLTVLNFMYNLKVQNIRIKFNDIAVNALELGETNKKLLNVITEANILSGIKITQHYEKQDRHSFIDFDYVLSLPLEDYNTMLQELQITNIETLIVVYEKLTYYEGLCNKLKEIIELFNGKKIIVVTDNILGEELKEHFGDKYRSVRDDNTYLIDLTEASQTKILKESTIVFQGDELCFKSVLHENARSLVRTEILQALIYKEKIEIGLSLKNQNYKDVNSFIERSLSGSDETYSVQTLHDIDEDVVVVTGRPGMGKSALLTHLALNTKLTKPLPWIVRLNLPDYEKEFTRWQEQSLTIDIPLVLQFLCKIALKNINKLTNIHLGHHTDQVTVSHVEEDIAPVTLFELELFLYLYNSGNVIFLFDDFNAMCPHYEEEMLQIFKLLKKEGKRMWIMTCPYKHTKSPLVNEFGNSYKLDPFHAKEKKVYLERFFKTNLQLEKLNYDQFENIRSFLEYMSKITNMRLVSDPQREVLPILSLTFHFIYVMAVKFFKSEINRASAATIRAKLRENFEIDLDQYSAVDDVLGRTADDEELELSGTPLHLYIAANYFKFRIEDSISFLLSEQEARNKWDFLLNSVTLYQHYIEAHMKRIVYKEDADNDFIVSTYQQTRKEFFEKHKKLGLFTICREKDLSKFMKPDEIDEIRETIGRIRRGEDRSSLIDCVVNEVPRFAHLVFAEYFAVECLSDMMKQLVSDNDHNPLMNAPLWQSILNILLFNASPGLRKAFNYKLQTDNALAEVAKSNICREVVFELLLKNDRRKTERDEQSSDTITDAIEDGFMNIVNLFISSAQMNLHTGNVNDALNLLRRSKDKLIAFGKEYADIVTTVVDSLENMDLEKLGGLLSSGRLTEVPVRHANDYCSSEGSELHRHVVAGTSQIPVLVQNIQQLCQQTNLQDTLKNVAQNCVQIVLNDMLDILKTQADPELD